jgi:hypothetical protein
LALSEKTKTVLERTLVRDKDDLYPDRSATPNADGTYPVKDTGSTYRHGDDVPTTTKDMNALFTWEHGDEIYGTEAKKKRKYMERYRRDINKAYGKQSQYKDLYIDTMGPKLISKQLEELK